MTISLSPNNWDIRYSPKMPLHPSVAKSGWMFSFPLAPAGVCPAPPTQPPNYNISACPHVDYVTTPYTKSMAANTSVSMTFVVAGVSPVFDFHTAADNLGATPATVRLLVEQQGDYFLDNPTYRWWSNPLSVPLTIGGPTTLLVPLTPDQWSDVNGLFGTAELAGFQAALKNVGNVGMTFGGGSFFGHGVYLTSGSATFNLTDFTVS